MAIENRTTAAVLAGYLLGRTEDFDLAVTAGDVISVLYGAAGPSDLGEGLQEFVAASERLSELSDDAREQLFEAVNNEDVQAIVERFAAEEDYEDEESEGEGETEDEEEPADEESGEDEEEPEDEESDEGEEEGEAEEEPADDESGEGEEEGEAEGVPEDEEESADDEESGDDEEQTEEEAPRRKKSARTAKK
ncbi:hypothetical protein [Arthrobacter monumenti]